jgi:quinolinate synthase
MDPEAIARSSARVRELKRSRGALLLVHNYQPPEIQDVADLLGDSLELSRKAAESDADVIVFAGVHFMAETAAMLAPERPVLLPRLDAGCPMADMIDPAGLRALRAQHPDAAVVCYVNSSAAVKALSTICCTSANAVKVVQSLGDRQVLFVPDENLGRYVARKLGRELIYWPGYCPTHERIKPEHVQAARERHPGFEVVVHPECNPSVVDVADFVESTGGMVRLARDPAHPRLLVGTETGMLYRLRCEAPDKLFEPVLAAATCPNMKRIGLGDIITSLETMEPRITVPPDIAKLAIRAVDRMLAVS